MTHDRLDRMIASRGLRPEIRQRILDRLAEANVSRDDPLAAVFVVEASVEEQVVLVACLPEAVTRRLRAELSDRNGELVAGLRDTVRDTLGEATGQAIRDMRHRAAWNLAALAAAAAIGLVGLGIAWGVQLGLDRQAGLFEAVAASPDAETWRTLIAANPQIAQTLADDCAPDAPLFRPQPDGRPACLAPIWLGDAPPRPPESFPARVMAELRHRVATAPGWVFLLLGILGTRAVGPLVRWIQKKT